MDALTRRWGRARLVLAVAAAILLTVGFIVPQLIGLRPWSDRGQKWRIAGYPPGQDTAQWTAFRSASSSDIAVWTAKANDNNKWDPRCDAVGAAILNDPTFSVQGNTLNALSNTDIWWATDIYGLAWGEALTPKKIVIDSTIQVDEAFGTFIHEAQHHARRAVSDAEIVAINDSLDVLTGGTLWLEHCHDEAREEEEDDPGEGGTATTCTDEEYTYTEWDWVYTEIEAGSCVGVSPVRWPWEEGGDDEEMHCTPARWGYVLMEVEKTGVRTVCVTTSN